MAETVDARVTVGTRARRALLLLAHPSVVATVTLLAGVGLVIAGVYILVGIGWTLLAGAVPCLLLSAVLIRGMMRAE